MSETRHVRRHLRMEPAGPPGGQGEGGALRFALAALECAEPEEQGPGAVTGRLGSHSPAALCIFYEDLRDSCEEH